MKKWIMFQFLIGRLKTRTFWKGARRRQQVFQFLIGRLKTKHMEQMKYIQKKVSIPYRQTQNVHTPLPPQRIYLCFNSLQVDSKRVKGDYPDFLWGVSIPYRQTQNREVAFWNTWVYGVSIPYRQTQNFLTLKCATIEMSGFQFLIGRLKTVFITKIAENRSCFNSLQVDSKRI